MREFKTHINNLKNIKQHLFTELLTIKNASMFPANCKQTLTRSIKNRTKSVVCCPLSVVFINQPSTLN